MSEAKKRTILISSMIISLLPAAFLMKFPTLVNLQTVSLYLSAVLGYMGIVLLLWMYILGTKSVFGLLFYDLAPVLSIHKWIGKYAAPLIFLHPVLITLGYGEQWFYSLIPQISSVAERHTLLGQIALWLLALTWVLSFFFKKKLQWHIWKYIHYLAYVCVPFALLHIPDLGSQERGSLLVKGYLFALGLTFLIFTIIRLRSLLNLEKIPYTIERHIQLTELDHMMKLAPQGQVQLKPRRGQYVYIKLGFLSEDHPFSVTQFNEATGEITLAYRLAGMYTKELQKLPQGSSVLLTGPYGSFTEDISTSDQPVVYIAGGIGITPFVDRIMNESATREQWLFAANRTADLAVLYEPLKKQLGDHAVAIYSNANGEPTPNEERGFTSAALLQKYLHDPLSYRYYICGPPAMMKAIRHELEVLDIPTGQVFTEKFGW